jgi:competence protein ComEA
MDPSAAPWRVLEAAEPSSSQAGGPVPAPPPAVGSLPVAPLTIAAAIGVVALAIGAFLFAASDLGGGSVRVAGAASLAPLEGVGGATDDPAAAGSDVIVVEIVGAVRAPGVFKLPPGSRIGDLVEAAGGYGPRLDAVRATLDLNLAARLADGDRVVVPSRDDVASSTSDSGIESDGGSASGPAAPAALVDLNRATPAELEALPGIGPVTAGKIIASREEEPFTTIDDLRTRKLVGAKTFDGLKDLVSVR